uniref:Uncharacterized protein n=1 Tax=Macrostomum lignano TaxID=282301 RepID=A0A1I8F9W6_9PLAT
LITAAAADAAVESPLACRLPRWTTLNTGEAAAAAGRRRDPDQGGREDGALMSASGDCLDVGTPTQPYVRQLSTAALSSLSARFQSYAAMDELIRAQADVNSIATEDYSHSPLDQCPLSRLYQAQAPLKCRCCISTGRRRSIYPT